MIKLTLGRLIHRVGDPQFGARLLCMGLLLILSACGTSGSNYRDSIASLANSAAAGTTSVSSIDAAIADDLTAIVSQIFNPLDTTLQINTNTTDPILQYLIGVLAEDGFGIQRVSADQGAHFVSYNRESESWDGVERITFAVTLGAVVVSRDYFTPTKTMITPASPVRLSGTRAQVVVNDDASPTKTVSNPAYSSASYVASLELDEQAPVISLITPQLVSQVAARSADGPSLQALNSNQVEINNLFYGDTSTFSSLLDDFEKVDRMVIVFGNDSMILGETNKALIDQFVETRLQTGDIISLVGCSNGPTVLDIGNEGLALGRAKRVTEALLARGIPADSVLNEGCWAPVNAGDRFPSRGVVMELWRRNA